MYASTTGPEASAASQIAALSLALGCACGKQSEIDEHVAERLRRGEPDRLSSERPRRVDVALGVVDQERPRRLESEPFEDTPEDLGVGLRHPLVAGDDDPVEAVEEREPSLPPGNVQLHVGQRETPRPRLMQPTRSVTVPSIGPTMTPRCGGPTPVISA